MATDSSPAGVSPAARRALGALVAVVVVGLGVVIGAFQLVQEKLVEMWQAVVQGQLLALRLGELDQAGRATHLHVSMGKRANVRMAREVARTAREILGANGISDEYPVMRHMMNLEAVYTYEGTHDIHTLALGKAITGMDAFA